MSTEEVSVERMVRAYVRIRESIHQLTREYDTQVAKLKEAQATIAAELRERMKAQDVKAMKTAAGTAFLTQKTRYYASDWESFSAFVLENNAVDLLEKRIAQRNMENFLNENPDITPPGLASDIEVTVTVRKN